MPETTVVFYRDESGIAPVRDWLNELFKENENAFQNCAAVIEDLEEFGHELRRPTSDTLRDGIKELRAKHQHVQYRILYFFDGKNFAVLAHAIINDDLIIDGISNEREKSCYCSQVEFETCKREKAHRFRNVEDKGGNRPHRKRPFKPDPDVNEHREACQNNG